MNHRPCLGSTKGKAYGTKFMKNIFKKFVVLLSLGFVLLGNNFVFADEISTPLVCTAPQILNEEGICADPIAEPLICTEPQILNEIGDECVDPVIEPTLDPINIHLEIIAGADSLYNNDILVNACDSDNDPLTINTITAYCAIKQLEKLETPITSDWSWYGTNAFVNSIDVVSSDFASFKYWTWLSDFDFIKFSFY